ncbi:MAG TPA: gamma-glutamyltransferase [Longimicrobiales bacterium]|nr:gamma-glutamyltransferase [Longimicrobiales bacterium]
MKPYAPAGGPSTWPRSWPFAPGSPGVRGRAVVATTDRYASEAGAAMLAAGGNAVDAAVAVAFALGVVNPEAGNVGGSGFLLARTAEGRSAALDYRSVAPRAASADLFLEPDGRVSERSQIGPLAAAVPGSVRGLWEAHRELGRLPWATLLEPAVRLARGFRVTERLTRSYPPHIVEALRRFPESARLFLPGGRVPRVGETLRQPELAATLERIQGGGADGFYRGETARLLVEAVQRGGGVLDLEDLAAYRAVWREPLAFRYRDHVVLSMPPSSSGGVTLAETAHIVTARDAGALPWHSDTHVHLLAEAWKRAFADRNRWLADADFVRVPVAELASPEHGARRATGIGERATPAEHVPTGLAPARDGSHTTHASIVDAEGNAVAMTTTLNTWYGSKWVAEGTGVLLNNEMDDFTLAPGAPNHFGLVQGAANAIEPGKRMLSAMTPTLVLAPRGALRLVLGAPGGATIVTSVFQVISNVLDYGMGLADAVAAPRVHHQHLPDVLDSEPGGLPAEVVSALEERGHVVREQAEPWGDVQAVAVLEGGVLEGASDPRRGGTPVAL